MSYNLDTFKVVMLLLVYRAESTFRVSRQPVTWDVAYSQCQNFGGRLAILENLEQFSSLSDRLKQIGLDSGSELWVAAKLSLSEWEWDGETRMPFTGEGRGYANRGCFHQQQWTSGVRLPNLSPKSCLDQCAWSGIVGLKKDFCMCEPELVNLSLVEAGVCHIPCEGSTSEMCGGLYGVSIYTPATKMVVWAEGEPRDGNNCVLLQKKAPGAELEFVTGDCNMQTRALCSFRNDEKCGLFHTCVRWTTDQFPWGGAVRGCQALGGHLAEMDNSRQEYLRDLKRLPPGNFWLALHRTGQWQWTNDVPVNILNFFGHEIVTSDGACAVVQNINGNIGLGARSCGEEKYYLCQYDLADEMTGPVPGAQRSTGNNESDVTSLPPAISVSTIWPTTQGVTTVHQKDNNSEADSNDSSMLTTCMYSFLGFISGMVCVLIVGMVVYCIFRCKTPDPIKHQQLHDKRRHNDNGSVSYSSRDGSVHVNSPPSDVTYDSVYDQGESPFRRTQRLIRMGSANTWRNAPSPKRQRTDTLDSAMSDYTWRGLIGGKMEVINTQLRGSHEPDGIQIHPRGQGSAVYEIHNEAANRLSAECEIHCGGTDSGYRSKRKSLPGDITPDLDALEGYYSLPSTSKRASGASSDRRSSRPLSGTENPSFLQLEAKTDEQSNEENIYATIKKTFQRIKDEIKNEQERENAEMMYTVDLNIK